MSFSSQVKDELNSLQIKGNCCKKAYIFGSLSAADVVEGKITVRLTEASTSEQLCHLLKSIYKIEPEKKEIRRGCYSAVELSFKSAKLTEFLSFADEFSGSDEDIETLDGYFGCENCKRIFARAAFCASGSVSDPKKSYTFEIHTKNDTRVWLIHSVLEEIVSEAPGITSRNGKFSIFYKNNSAIEDVLTVIGANKTLFEFLDSYVEKDLRNYENRATNCVTRNISKSVNAAGAQIAAIEALIANGMLEELGEEIHSTAELRIDNPALSLTELAELHTPPISKSGLNHRLTKIVELAKKRKLI